MLASIVAVVVVVAAIAQQSVPGFQLATQFAEVLRRLPPAMAVLFPLTAILAQVAVVIRLSRWLERRKLGLVTGSLVSLGAGVLVCTGVSFFSAWLAGRAGTNPGLRVLKGLLSAFEIHGLWLRPIDIRASPTKCGSFGRTLLRVHRNWLINPSRVLELSRAFGETVLLLGSSEAREWRCRLPSSGRRPFVARSSPAAPGVRHR